jgi:hypothetical protein
VDGWHGIDPDRTATLQRTNRTSSDDAPTLTRNLLAAAVGVAYLVDRHVRLEGAGTDEASGIWFKALLASILSVPLAFANDPVSENAEVVMFGYGWWFMPFAVYFDAEYVGDANDWDPMSGLWAVMAFFTRIFGGGAYLLGRNQMTD